MKEEQKINVRMRKAEPSVRQAKQIQAQVRQITKLSEDLRSARESNQAQQLKAVAAETAERGYQQQIAQIKFEAEVTQMDNDYLAKKIKRLAPEEG